jgi:hypothetical protein
MKQKHKLKFKARQLDLFWYWINERHRIYLAKKANKPWPWTSDKILQSYRFCNVFRQLDIVTEAWGDRYAKMPKRSMSGDILFQCCLFRLFNWPQTYDALHFGLPSGKWNRAKAVKIIDDMKAEGKQIFTGAYIIPSAGRTDPKHWMICETLDKIHADRDEIAADIMDGKTMEAACHILRNYHSIGPFIAYEIACDLRHTKVLADAPDVRAWANPGPGAQRGIHRLITGTHKWEGGPRPDYQAAMRTLLEMAKGRLLSHVKKCEWPFEMREIEHSLCEYDKYMRVKMKQGKPRSRYTYKAQLEMF